jgi:hypothetical protein
MCSLKKCDILLSKIAINLTSIKDVQATGEAFSLNREHPDSGVGSTYLIESGPETLITCFKKGNNKVFLALGSIFF